MRTALTLAALLAMGSAAAADCFENIGCTNRDVFPRSALRRLSCENLWYVRNKIYDENGLCFRTAAARAQFDNSDCFVNNPARVRLNRVERANLASIRRVERQFGCTAD